MTTVDDLIRSDLSELGTETARAVPEFSTLAAQLAGTGGPYRDSEPGAEARRRARYDDRVRELALMPLAYERVFVHRVSRAAAGAAAIGGVGIALFASMDPWTHRLALALVGHPTPALIAAMLGAFVLGAYVVAGLVAELFYERRMRSVLSSDGDLQRDLDRLDAVGPTDEARRLLDRVDGAAVALPLAGAVSGGLLLGLVAFFSDPGYSALALVWEAADVLIPATFVGLAAALLLGGACRRDRSELDRSALLAVAEHWGTFVLAAALKIAALWYAARTAYGLHAFGVIPTERTTVVLGALGVAALLVPSAWVILWWRRREARRLG